MTDSNFTAVAIVVDRSGSMGSMRAEAEGGVNALIQEQAKDAGRTTVRVDQFDDYYESVFKSVDAKDAPKYVLEPRGMTALLDAIGKSIVDFGKELSDMPENERPGNVVFAVMTDGFENRSREYTAERIKELIKEHEDKYNWTFLFLGADLSVSQAASLGFGAHNTITFDSSNVANATNVYGAASSYVTRTRTGDRSGFTEAERLAAVAPKTN